MNLSLAFARLREAALALLRGVRPHADKASASAHASAGIGPAAADRAAVMPEAAKPDAGAPAAVMPNPAPPQAVAVEPLPTAAPLPEAPPMAPAPLPDPDHDRLLARSARLQEQKLEFGAKLAEMERLVREFERRQYEALHEVLAECLRLRHEHARLQAERSGAEADVDAARAAADDFESYQRSAQAQPPALPELDESERDELRRLYRTAASRCHPDRAGEADKEEAHARFLRVQEAYRNNDAEALRRIIDELQESAGTASAQGASTAPAVGDGLRRLVGELQNEVADLILGVQTLQLDPTYREARASDDWDAHFAGARRAFEQECATLRRHIRSFDWKLA